MPCFRNELPPEKAHQGYELLRTPCSSALVLAITCENLVVVDTHYWHGRTLPCERLTNDEGRTTDDSNCPACREKQGYRTHIYVSAIKTKTREHVIFECTATAAKPLEEYRKANKTLRGCVLNATRPKGGPNSKVVISTNTLNQQHTKLPEPPNVPAALATIWRLPRTAIQTLLETDESARILTIPAKLREMRQQPDDGNSYHAFEETKRRIEDALFAAVQPNGKKPKPKVPA